MYEMYIIYNFLFSKYFFVVNVVLTSLVLIYTKCAASMMFPGFFGKNIYDVSVCMERTKAAIREMEVRVMFLKVLDSKQTSQLRFFFQYQVAAFMMN